MIKLLTPSQVWQGYDPKIEPLETLKLSEERTEENIMLSKYTFVSETREDGKARVFATVTEPSGNEKKPAVLILESLDKEAKLSTLLALSRPGRIAVSIDYSALSKSVYPESMKECKLSEALDSLTRIETTVKETPWYLWTTVVRRALTFIESLEGFNGTIILIGVKNGGEIAWQVAGTDSRVSAFVPIFSLGYTEFGEGSRFDLEHEIEMTEERACWLSGVASETYAKNIECPVLMLSATNNAYASIDRAGDIASLIRGEVFQYFTPNQKDSLSKEGRVCLEKWLDYVVKDIPFPKSPKITFSVSGGRPYFTVSADIDYGVEKVELFYATEEYDRRFRNWKPAKIDKTGEREYISTIEVYSGTAPIFAYASVTYKNGISLCSDELFIKTETLELSVFPIKKRRVLFSGDSDINTFAPLSKRRFIPKEEELCMSEGSQGVFGLCSGSGAMISYEIGDNKYSKEEKLLQLDVYSAEPKLMDIILTEKKEKVTDYKYCVWLTGNYNEWQKITLKPADFKDATLMPLKNFDFVKSIAIENADGVLINNLLWI